MRGLIGHIWYTFGISYKKADVNTRSQFVFDDAQIERFYSQVLPQNECYGLIISTCNRTTFFLLGKNPEGVENEFARVSGINLETYGYRYKSIEAVNHLMEMGSGLDSQIIGDFEIIGQIRRAFTQSQSFDRTHGVLEKLLNHTIYTSRRVKNETSISTGTTSVSYAVVQFMRDQLLNFESSDILILGAGDMSKRAIGNLVATKDASGIYVSNRTDAKAQALSKQYGVNWIPWSEWKLRINEFSGVVSAVSSNEHIITAKDLLDAPSQVLLDISVPATIDPECASVKGRSVFDVDQISAFVSTNLSNRASALPEAKRIIDEEVGEFYQWELAQEASTLIEDCIAYIQNKWLNEKKDEDRVSDISHKIGCRLFDEIRTNPERAKDIAAWLDVQNA